MSEKPTYEELEQKIKEFEKKVLMRSQLEGAMLESEEKYRKLFHHSNDGIFLHDFEGNIIDMNQKVLDCFGYTKPEMLATKIPLLHPPEALKKSKFAFETIIRYGFVNFEIDFIKKNGEVFPAEVSSSLFKIGGKQVIQGIVRDVTDRKQIMETLRESEERFRSIFHAETDAIMVFDAETFRFIEANDATLNLYGYTQEEFLKLTPVDISAEPERTYKAVTKIATHQPIGEVGLLERKQIKKDGTVFSTEISSSIFFLKGRKMVCGIVRDISERKATEEALRESEERYRLLVENANDAIFIIEDGLVKFPNLKTEEMTGYSEKELSEIPFINIIHPDDREMVLERRRKRLLGEKPPSTYSFRMINKSGDELLAQINTVLINWEGRPATINFIRDITEQKRLEVQLQQAQKMKSLGLLAGGVAHDLNNVLAGIVSNPELILLDLPEDSKLRKPIETIQESGHRATAIVQDLLTVARGVAITKEPLNLNDLVSDYLNSPEFKKLKQFHPTVTIKINLDSNLFNMSGSHVHIRKVIMNLVSNASEAIEDSGNVIISTMNRYIDRPLKGYDDVTIGEYAVLAVSDDGSGISSGDLEKIFDPFYTKKRMGRSGTGLGLAVVWNVVQDHEGYIDVKSDQNGTTFKLYFPITREEISGEDLSIPIKDYKGNGEIILVVDDVESQIDISCKMLDKLGYKTKAASSGEEAVEYLKENTVDLILLDMIMDPGINGRETYEQIIKIHPSQKAIITSGFAETDDVKEAQRLGAGQYIKKPLTLEKIGIAVMDELKK